MSDAVSGPPADDQAAPTVWWSPKHNALVGKHKYGECFDLIEQDDMGWRDTEELSALPADAVRLVPAPAVAVPAETRDTDELAEAEREVREAAVVGDFGRAASDKVLLLLAEYDRRGDALDVAESEVRQYRDDAVAVARALESDAWSTPQLVRDAAAARAQVAAVRALADEWESHALISAGPPEQREHDYLDPSNVDDHREAGSADALDACAAALRAALGGTTDTPKPPPRGDIQVGDVVEFEDDGGVLGKVTAIVAPGRATVKFPNGVVDAQAADLVVIQRPAGSVSTTTASDSKSSERRPHDAPCDCGCRGVNDTAAPLVCSCTATMRAEGRRCEGCIEDDQAAGSVHPAATLTFELYEHIARLAYAAHLEWFPIQKWRLGQAYSNVLHALAPRVQERMEKDGLDCFYRDDMIPGYIAAVRAVLAGTATPEPAVENWRDTNPAHAAFCDGSCEKGAVCCPAMPSPLLGTWADPEFRAHQDHKHPVPDCGYCPSEDDDPFGTTCVECGEPVTDERPAGEGPEGPVHYGCGEQCVCHTTVTCLAHDHEDES